MFEQRLSINYPSLKHLIISHLTIASLLAPLKKQTAEPPMMEEFPNLSFNIAVALCGDIGTTDKDPLRQFLRNPEPVKTDDHTETVLINAVKDMVQNRKSGGFSINQISSPHGDSFLRVDASIWIGTPNAPMGWEVPSIKQGWHKDQRLGTLKYVGHPAVRHDCPLTPPADDDHKGNVKGEGSRSHHMRKRQHQEEMSDIKAEHSQRRKRQRIWNPEQEPALGMLADLDTEEHLMAHSLKGEPSHGCQDDLPSSALSNMVQPGDNNDISQFFDMGLESA